MNRLSFLFFHLSFFYGFIIAKKFGVTEFVNPKEHDRPVQEVNFCFFLL